MVNYQQILGNASRKSIGPQAEQREKSDLEQRQVGFHCVAPLQGWLKIVHGIKSFDDLPSKFSA